MAPASIHQAIHGYRDGHRLLSSSTPLSGDAARAMLVLSDMSGPSMQPGFDEYLTGYPLPGTDLFVLAKSWYAPEMQRPGCVWTHSLLIPRAHVAQVTTARLLENFRRPLIEGVDKAAITTIAFSDDASRGSDADGFNDRAVAAALVGALLGQPRPVIVAADAAAQFESVFLRIWEELWPAERARFSFCTGALMPRSNAGALLDLQAVPRAIPSSQFRKSANTALVVDPRTPSPPVAWVELLLDGAARGDTTFRTWLEAAAGENAGRSLVPTLVPLFGEWHAPTSSSRSILASVVGAGNVEPATRSRLVGMAFDRADTEAGATRRRELLQDLCGYRDADLASLAAVLEDQTRRLFEDSRAEGIALVLSLLGSELTEVGERVLRVAVLLLVPSDLDAFGEAQTPLLPTIVGANPSLASSPVLWKRVGGRSADVLSQLGATNVNEDERSAVVAAIISSGRDVPVDALFRFGGKPAMYRGLDGLASGQIQLSWPWRSALSAQQETVLEWLEGHPSLTQRELELGTQFLSPKANQARLTTIWQNGTAGGTGSVSPRVAAFGLALALAAGNTESPLLAVCFQPTYEASGCSRLEYEEWDWLRDYAPPVVWWRDWDKCERLAAALGRLIEQQKASLEIVFGILSTRQPIRRVAALLDENRATRPYLKSLRKTAETAFSIGTREQRDALLEGL